ncbi:hypothetical protein L5515_011115 [Caenorhabditis briggsae]|uniref:Serpentine receptor class gamma n=1 Tax=Caenorhabditis briggsae TaxID=6238 RepID=A0AAE9EVJ6_CAEBR|nr:hypothetical protein L5515_011115 [Caenorhabditis briggsae]
MYLISKIWLGYGLISVFFSAFLVFVISTSPLSNQSFYRLIVIHLVIVILSWINSWPTRVVWTEDAPYFAKALYDHTPRLFSLFMFLGIAFCHIQSWSSIVICVNRLRTANPEKYEERNKWWNRWFILIYVIVIVLSLLAAHYLAITPTVRFYEETGKFGYVIWDLADGIMQIFFLVVFLGLYILISLIFGCIAVCKIKKHQDGEFHHSSLVTLVHIFLRVFCLTLLLCSFFLQVEDFTVEMMITIFDLMTFSMTYIILFYDESVREAIRSSCTSETVDGR